MFFAAQGINSGASSFECIDGLCRGDVDLILKTAGRSIESAQRMIEAVTTEVGLNQTTSTWEHEAMYVRPEDLRAVLEMARTVDDLTPHEQLALERLTEALQAHEGSLEQSIEQKLDEPKRKR